MVIFCNCTNMNGSENLERKKDVILYLVEKWQLSDLDQISYPSVFNNYIAYAYSNVYQQDVILKICESNDECKALQYLQGNGIVKLLDYDHEYYALLLEFIPCQGTLADFFLEQDDDVVINAFVDLFKKIHSSPKDLIHANWNTLQNDFAVLTSFTFTKIPANLLQKAIQISYQLSISNEPQYLLHCDLHCRNILQCKDSFIAIDPWSSVGPLEYEAASFLTSPTDLLLLRDDIKEVLQNRLNKLSDLLHLNKQQLKDYSFMRVMLLACLCESRNKNDDWIEQFIQVAKIIDQLD